MVRTRFLIPYVFFLAAVAWSENPAQNLLSQGRIDDAVASLKETLQKSPNDALSPCSRSTATITFGWDAPTGRRPRTPVGLLPSDWRKKFAPNSNAPCNSTASIWMPEPIYPSFTSRLPVSLAAEKTRLAPRRKRLRRSMDPQRTGSRR